MIFQRQEIAEKGINAAILDYHVDPKGPMGGNAEMIRMAGEDGLAAVRYLRTNAEKYHILPDHIAIGGFSAGGMTREQIAEAARLDNVRNIRPDCPPMFVFQTHGDDPRIALNFCMELAVHGVSYEIHTFEDGPHGGGLYNGKDETPDIPHTAMWADLAADWLLKKGYGTK